MARLYAFDLSPFIQNNGWERLLPYLSPRRRDRALSINSGADAARCAAVGFALSRALDDEGIPTEHRIFSENEYGKPYFTGAQNVCFSLSHSGNWAVCAVGASPLGVDIELPRCTMTIAKRFFHPGEFEYVSSQSPERQPDILARLWTLKEAYSKALGTGFHTDPRSFCIELFDGKSKISGVSDCNLYEFRLGEYYLALCSQETECELQQIYFEQA